jgi:hypothetical protein
MTALYRFGQQAHTIRDVCNTFSISKGFVHIFTCRVIVALYLLQNIVIPWPNCEEKQRIISYIEIDHGFPHVVRIMDDTFIPLASMPISVFSGFFPKTKCGRHQF